MSLTSQEFYDLMKADFTALLDGQSAIAIGVSGGPDSMALLWLLQEWCAKQGKDLHALSVDHGLRVEAKDECALVAQYCDQFGHVRHQILTLDELPEKRLQEEARLARYAVKEGYCEAHGIQHLFLAHHQKDQAETFLFRLAKGSGLDGLSGMRKAQNFGSLILCRPLLEVSKEDLIAICQEENIPFSQDPSNENEIFARVRLRQSMDVLAGEGLTLKRLAVTAKRLDRGRLALDEISKNAFNERLLYKDTNRVEFNNDLCDEHEEILIRCLQKAIFEIGDDRDYAPRLERIETLAHDLKHDLSFRKRTLGGVIFERDDKRGVLILSKEKLDVSA